MFSPYSPSFFSKDDSVNDAIDPEECVVSYFSFDAADFG